MELITLGDFEVYC
ncbi:hypothetical protein AB3S75_023762 [Citrus x aurantiifolia]